MSLFLLIDFELKEPSQIIHLSIHVKDRFLHAGNLSTDVRDLVIELVDILLDAGHL